MERSTERALWAFTAPEIALQVVLFPLLAANPFGDSSFFPSVSREIQTAAFVFFAIELLVPLAVYLDLRRRPERSDTMWVHAAAMPVFNVFALLAYLADSKSGPEE